MDYPKRKSPRIPNFDYSSNHYYFVTICTNEKKCIFGNPGKLNQYGCIANQCLQEIPNIYPEIILDKYVVMPNHIHAVLVIDNETKTEKAINLTRIIGQYKMSVTKKIREKNPDMQVWQRSFHDHIIRNQTSYEKIWQYIENNPLKWEEDCFYC